MAPPALCLVSCLSCLSSLIYQVQQEYPPDSSESYWLQESQGGELAQLVYHFARGRDLCLWKVMVHPRQRQLNNILNDQTPCFQPGAKH